MITRIKISLIFMCLLLLVLCRKEKPMVPPNILFITTEGQAWEDMTEYQPFLSMPTLDQFYQEGVVFENHYSTAPLSVPSLYSIISGQYPHTHQMSDNGVNWLPAETATLMERLSKVGYFTAGIGKMDIKPWERMAGFDERIIADGWGSTASDTLKKDQYYYYLKKAGFSRWDYLKEISSFGSNVLKSWPLPDSLEIDRFIGAETVKYLQSETLKKQKNWMLWVSFNGPDFKWKRKDQSQIQNIEMPKPRLRNLELEQKPHMGTFLRYRFYKEFACNGDEDSTLWYQSLSEAKLAYYNNLEMIDQQLDQIMNALKKNHQLDHTIIIFTSTHGMQLGDHYIMGSGTFYERSAHVPFIIWWPSYLKKKHIKEFSSHVDILPTLAGLAGISNLQGCEGVSLLPVAEGIRPGANHALLEVLDGHMLVTKNYKLAIYSDYKEGEFYNRVNDPNELLNAFDLPVYRPIIDSMYQIMAKIDPKTIALAEINNQTPALVSEISLKQGISKFNHEVPQFSGNGIRLVADVSFGLLANGPVVTYESDYMHGFSLFAQNGQLYFGIRTHNKEAIYPIPGNIRGKRVEMELVIHKYGTMTVKYGNQQVLIQERTIWPQYGPMGKPQNQIRAIFGGIYGSVWSNPYGDLKRGLNLDGIVHRAKLSVIQ